MQLTSTIVVCFGTRLLVATNAHNVGPTVIVTDTQSPGNIVARDRTLGGSVTVIVDIAVVVGAEGVGEGGSMTGVEVAMSAVFLFACAVGQLFVYVVVEKFDPMLVKLWIPLAGILGTTIVLTAPQVVANAATG